MDFSGFERLSLLDFDDHISCTLFFAGCNFRCPFCHNSSLVLDPSKAKKIPWAEIKEYLKKRQGILDAVCVSGGEPTLMPDLADKLQEIKNLGYLVKLDTNGSRPDVLKELVSLDLLDYVAMDIKNSMPKYAMTMGTNTISLDAITESIRFLNSSAIDHEFRTTAINEYHSLKDFEDIGVMIKGAKRYFIQRYIDNENCIKHGLHELPIEKALEAKALMEEYVPYVALRGYSS